MSASLVPLLKDLSALNLGRGRLFRLILMVSDRCALRCKTCRIWQRSAADRSAGSLPSLAELTDFFHRNEFSWINLTGGEIFLRDDLEEIFQLIATTQKDLGLISFPTTGYQVDRTVRSMEQVLRMHLPRITVTVSLDGGRETHDRLRGVPGAFSRAKETFQALRKLARTSRNRLTVVPGLTLSADLLALTPDPVGELIAQLEGIAPGEIHVNLAHCSEHYYGNPEMSLLPEEQTGAQIRALLKTRPARLPPLNLLEHLYLQGALRYLATNRPPLACRACQASVFVDSHWSVYPCTIFSRALGNLKDFAFNLNKLAATPAFKATQKEVKAGACPGCWTPCEAYPSLLGRVFSPALYRLFLGGTKP